MFSLYNVEIVAKMVKTEEECIMSECLERQVFDAKVSFEIWTTIPFTIIYGLSFTVLQLLLSLLYKNDVVSDVMVYVIIMLFSIAYAGIALYIRRKTVAEIFPLTQTLKKLSTVNLNNNPSGNNTIADNSSLKIADSAIKLSYDIIEEKIIKYKETLMVAQNAPFNIFYSGLLLLAVAFVSSPLENDKVPLFIIPLSSFLKYIGYYCIYVVISLLAWVITLFIRKYFRDTLVKLLRKERNKPFSDESEM